LYLKEAHQKFHFLEEEEEKKKILLKCSNHDFNKQDF